MNHNCEEEVILRGRNISKSFLGVQALNEVSIAIKKGEVHAIVGENGAGKSNLIKIFSGFYMMDEGEIIFEDSKVNIDSTKFANQLGIKTVYQIPEIAPNLDVAENIMLGSEPLNWGFINKKQLYERTEQYILALNLNTVLDPSEKAGNLNIYKKRLLEICKICSTDAKIIIMDEPTAALSRVDVDSLFQIVNKLRNEKITIIYISHLLEEIFEIANTVSVLRDGAMIGTRAITKVNKDDIVKMMIGKSISTQGSFISPGSNDKVKDRKVVLSVKNMVRRNVLNDISFYLYEGEVLGITGLSGAGRTELARAIIGLDKIDCGEIFINNKKVKIKRPSDAIKCGIGYLTEDRYETLIQMLSVYINVIIAAIREVSHFNFWIKTFDSKKRVNQHVNRLRIQTPNLFTPVDVLSGGNQQKTALARWIFSTNLKILILDDPTIGIDIGTKEEIYQIIHELKNSGMSIILISSFFNEVLRNSDRILVMKKGNLVGQFYPSDLSAEDLLKLSLPEVKR